MHESSENSEILCCRVNLSIVAFSSWSMLYQHTRHRNRNKFKTLCQKVASVFELPVASGRNWLNFHDRSSEGVSDL